MEYQGSLSSAFAGNVSNSGLSTEGSNHTPVPVRGMHILEPHGSMPHAAHLSTHVVENTDAMHSSNGASKNLYLNPHHVPPTAHVVPVNESVSLENVLQGVEALPTPAPPQRNYGIPRKASELKKTRICHSGKSCDCATKLTEAEKEQIARIRKPKRSRKRKRHPKGLSESRRKFIVETCMNEDGNYRFCTNFMSRSLLISKNSLTRYRTLVFSKRQKELHELEIKQRREGTYSAMLTAPHPSNQVDNTQPKAWTHRSVGKKAWKSSRSRVLIPQLKCFIEFVLRVSSTQPMHRGPIRNIVNEMAGISTDPDLVDPTRTASPMINTNEPTPMLSQSSNDHQISHTAEDVTVQAAVPSVPAPGLQTNEGEGESSVQKPIEIRVYEEKRIFDPCIHFLGCAAPPQKPAESDPPSHHQRYITLMERYELRAECSFFSLFQRLLRLRNLKEPSSSTTLRWLRYYFPNTRLEKDVHP